MKSKLLTKLKEGDTVEISGFYFDWIVKNGYSKLLKKEGLFMTAHGGLMHSNEFDRIIKINGRKVDKGIWEYRKARAMDITKGMLTAIWTVTIFPLILLWLFITNK